MQKRMLNIFFSPHRDPDQHDGNRHGPAHQDYHPEVVFLGATRKIYL